MNSFPMFKWLIRGLAVTLGLTLAWYADTPALSQDRAQPGGALAKIPADAAAFLHIRVQDVWKAEAAAGIREMFNKSGPEALAAFNKRYTPAPSTLESVAIYVLPPGEDGPPAVGVVAAFSQDFDQTKVLKSLLPKGIERNHFGQKFVEDAVANTAIKVIDGKTLLISERAMMPRLVSYDAKESGALTPHFASAASKAIYGVFDVAAMPKEMWDQVPEPLRPITSAKEAVLSIDVRKDFALRLALRYPDASAASAANQAVREGLKAAQSQMAQMIQEAEKKVVSPPKDKPASLANLPEAIGELMGLGSMKALDDFLNKPPLATQGDSLVMEYRFDPSNPNVVASTMAMAMGVMMPAVEKTRAAATRVKGQNNLRQIALAMHNYHEASKAFPAHAIYTKDKRKPLLSWRVELLPYLGEDALYKQFKLDEPWDSDDNKKLIAKMPAVYVDPDAAPGGEPGVTHYQVFVGGGAGFRPDAKGIRIFDVTDGSSNSIMVAVATNPVPWTKPDDLPYGPGKAMPKLGISGKPISVAMFDGSVKSLEQKTPERVLRAMITIAGGELIGDDF